jgi:predicted nucleic acid-binding Zn ribbon protein
MKINIMKWLKEDVEKAIELNQNGKRFDEIAQLLNRNTRGVQVKLNKLGFGENKISPKENLICINCDKEFSGFKKNKRKFCSQTCAAQFNNKKYPKRKNSEKLTNCLYCGNPLNYHQNKFCSHTCNTEFNRNEIFQKIENGDTTFSSDTYKKYLIYKYGEKCMKCGWNEINPVTGLIPIQLEHKNGNSENHNLNNLELLCPNHHSLTPTYGALNKGNGRTKRREKRKSLAYLNI